MLRDLYLNTDPPATKPIPPIAAHAGAVSALAFSPRGDLLASAGPDAVGKNAIKFWTVPGGRPFGKSVRYASMIGTIAFDETGRIFAATGHDGSLILGDMASGKRKLLGTRGPIEAVAFSAGGRLAVAGSKSVIFWDWDGKEIETFRRAYGDFEHSQRAAFAVVLGDDGRVLATVGNDGTITLQDLVTRDVIAVFGSGAGPTSLALSPDARTLATVDDDGTPVLWDTDVRRVLDRIGASPDSAPDQPPPFGCR
jgi:WD40 repeat protein